MLLYAELFKCNSKDRNYVVRAVITNYDKTMKSLMLLSFKPVGNKSDHPLAPLLVDCKV